MTTFWHKDELAQDRRRRWRLRDLPGKVAGGTIVFLWIGVQRIAAWLQGRR